jgi:hypothetical protein
MMMSAFVAAAAPVSVLQFRLQRARISDGVRSRRDPFFFPVSHVVISFTAASPLRIPID